GRTPSASRNGGANRPGRTGQSAPPLHTITIPRYRVQDAPLAELTEAVRASAGRVTKLLSADAA
ncbi:hypothetical protein ACKLTP_13890, partial [Paenarthrobacter ureafaciens]|uniref:hypothetical protein n=1 Tax=Paenarthrobacter ureafaciens TaxID=37931 RepID=UPI00397CBAB2